MANRLISAALATGVATTALIGISAGGAAAVDAKTYTRSYSKSTNFYSAPLKRCVRTTLSGKVTFTYYLYRQHSAADRYYNVKLVEPKMKISVLTKCSGGKAATLTDASLTQRWYESTCKLDAAVTAGYPWTVAVTPTVECGKHDVGTRSTKYSAKATTYTQNNSGRPVAFSGDLILGRDPEHGSTVRPLCLSGRPTVTAYISNKSDSWTKTLKACVKP